MVTRKVEKFLFVFLSCSVRKRERKVRKNTRTGENKRIFEAHQHDHHHRHRIISLLGKSVWVVGWSCTSKLYNANNAEEYTYY